MKIPTLCDIVNCLTQLEVKKANTLPSLGLYCPDLLEIRYNPKRIRSQDEFILTIIHECVHHLDPDFELEEKHTELLAEYLCSNKRIRSYIRRCFSKELKKYPKN